MPRNAVLEPVLPSEQEVPAIRSLASALSAQQAPAFLVGTNGEALALPESVYRLLLDILQMMMQGHAINLVPIDQEMTTQEAAEILNISRPTLIKLLEKGDLPFKKVGTHRRICFRDLMEYKHRMDQQTETALAELAELSEELDLY